MSGADELAGRCRIDKWLWAARFYKTRSAAGRAVAGGKVHLNGRRVKPAAALSEGDRLRVRKGPREWTVIVQKLSERRGPAVEARTLYEETEESRIARERRAEQRRAAPTFSFREKGRPSKKELRQLRRLKGKPVD